ncbi:MAG: hypothetical protein HZB50_02190 [Chloroflexi bacterium]|nr:hypothetical protein [Chloroflexota bacterium]
MKRRWLVGLLSILIAFSGIASAPVTPSLQSDRQPAFAPNPPPGPDRYTVVTVDYTAYEWYLVTWKDHKVVCSVTTNHEGAPLPEEVFRDCTEKVYDKWTSQLPCLNKLQELCDGYYTFPISSWADKKEIPMQLASASAWISLGDCQPVLSTSTNICESTPTLVITGQEPLQNEKIIRVEGTYNGQPFDCDKTDTCKFHIPETDLEGVSVEFWAYSSYGDSSIIYSAQVRVRKAAESDPDQTYWYVDVLSPQWKGTVAMCSDAWNIFPPVGGPPKWLTTPRQSEELSSDIPYTYLARNLIMQGAVDTSACTDGGLDPNGNVNQCGLEMSRDAVTQWQNQFDDLILSTAQGTGVPARLLKKLFARESQFWPGSSQVGGDTGLGQLTENGADSTLFWNPSFYAQFCPLVFPGETCGNGYMHISDEEQQTLRLALVSSVNATCKDCPLGIDLSRADFSVGVFAHSMIASCKQAGQVITNYSDQSPGEVASYEDLWKFSLVNYNAGGGCLAEAITRSLGEGNTILTWENTSPFISGACAGAVSYVNDISK